MPEPHGNLSETHIVGDRTHLTTVRADECPALAQRHIAHVGVGDVAAPYQIVRTHLSGAYLHGCLGGEGRMLLDGRWRPHRAGMTSLAPAHVLHAFHAIAAKRWQVCWVRYMPSSPRSKTGAIAPVMARFDSYPLSHAIHGLAKEMGGAGDAGSCVLWVDLIERYVSRFVEPWRREDRLFTVWDVVRQDLARPWTLDQLAAIARISSEHLRRLCQTSLGRSPIQQLRNLRIQQAAHLLATTEAKIEVISGAVGYRNPFTFSNTFQRMTGLRPSRFRSHRRRADEGFAP